VKLGLPEDVARDLARQTVIGSGVVLGKSGREASDLRKAVSSAGGTTQAALEVLSAEDGLPRLMRRAVKAAHNRSRELGGKPVSDQG